MQDIPQAPSHKHFFFLLLQSSSEEHFLRHFWPLKDKNREVNAYLTFHKDEGDILCAIFFLRDERYYHKFNKRGGTKVSCKLNGAELQIGVYLLFC